MKRLWWSCGVVGAAAVALGALVFTVRLPDRSAFLAREQSDACRLAADRSPFGAVTSCVTLGRRTPLSGDPDGSVFLFLETSTGPVTLRIDYRDTDAARRFTAEAVEISPRETPGISNETAKRLQKAIDERGGMRPSGWTVHDGGGA